MTPPSITTPVLQTLSAQQVEQLKQRICGTLSYIVNTNSRTVYFLDAPLLARYRTELRLDASHNSVPIPGAGKSEVDFSTFTASVPLSTYEDYRPYILRFMESPCLQSSVDNLLAPGLPMFIATSSGTSGSSAKYLPKYAHPMTMTVKSIGMSIPEVHGPTKCAVFSLRYTHTLDVLDGAQRVVKAIPFSIVSAGDFRSCNGWEIENDVELIKTRLSGHVTPVAVAFIKPYYTFLLMHALFAIGERSLTTFNMIFITVFFDLVRLVEDHWRTSYTQLKPGRSLTSRALTTYGPISKPREGAAENSIDMHDVGWLKQIWPNLTLVIGNVSGPFSAVLPRVRSYVGPSVSVQGIVYASSEAWIGAIYNPNLATTYVERPESAEYITQAWNLEVGKKYEVVLTTRDGLWRYRLGDVLEIAGFAPEDGSPLIRFLERRSAVMRVALEFVTEAELREAVRSIEDDIGRVVEFSVVIDDRWFPRRYGFLLELESGLEPENAGPRAHAAPRRLQEYLSSTNSTFARFSSDSVVPVVEDRGLWKWGGQMKVPTVVYNPEMKDWLIGNVVQELGDGLRKIT
ncbi:GH3 auxin-responsive promoter-domain-containing protein [Infundibulicybe gibba]|nr:GH3 auxin-responsive promoter-domain-containing protein [Infundibulicybe gibba]